MRHTYIIKQIRDFDCSHIFDCGQCFRWQKQSDGSYTGIAGGRVANIKFILDAGEPAGGTGTVEIREYGKADEEDAAGGLQFWRNYLDLNRDYGKMKRKLGKGDAVMRKAIRFGWGIRILNQDLWETIVSFIISQNNHIPRIKSCIENLATRFGEPVAEDSKGKIWYDLPSPQVLASLTAEDLAPVKLGYRAGYLIETARKVCADGLPESPQELTELCGVGPKVASCIALFGMGRRESFPIDVWVIRVMHQFYGLDEKDKKAMADFAEEKFGMLGGLAQQYLFFYIRERG